MEEFQIFDKNHGPTPLEKSQFLNFSFFYFFLHFYNLKTLFSFLEYGRAHFPGLFFFKKGGKNSNF